MTTKKQQFKHMKYPRLFQAQTQMIKLGKPYDHKKTII